MMTVALCAMLLGAVGDGDAKRERTIEEINDLNANNPDADKDALKDKKADKADKDAPDVDDVNDRNANNKADDAAALEGLDVDSWPAASKRAAADMVERYGQPDDVTDKKLIWEDVGGFKKIMVSREATAHRFPAVHSDVLTYVVDYKVPASKFDDLAAFDGSLVADRTKGELSARCDRHEMNLAALNLADDIIKGKKTVAQARVALSRIATQVKQDNPPPTARRLQFDGTRTATADPDRPANRAVGR